MSKGFCNFDFLIRFLIAEFQGLEDFILGFSQGVGIGREGGGPSLGGWSRGDGGFLCVEDLLRGARRTRGQLGLVASSAVPGIITNLPTFETVSFPHAFCSFLWSELFEFYKVHIHGVRVMGSSRDRERLGLEIVIVSPLQSSLIWGL